MLKQPHSALYFSKLLNDILRKLFIRRVVSVLKESIFLVTFYVFQDINMSKYPSPSLNMASSFTHLEFSLTVIFYLFQLQDSDHAEALRFRILVERIDTTPLPFFHVC